MRAQDEKGRAARRLEHELADYQHAAIPSSKKDTANVAYIDLYGRDLDETSVELRVLLDKFQDYFAGRSQGSDVPIVLFGLQHLFSCMHTLCTLVLPEITREGVQNIPNDDDRGRGDAASNAYGLWLLLQNGIELLLKIEPLCQLVQNALMQMVETLDATCSIRNLANLQDTDEMIQVAYSAKRRCTYIVTRDQDHWQWAVTSIRKRITSWRRQTLERLTRLRQEGTKVAGEERALALLECIASVNRLVNGGIESSGAIFGDILPDLHLLAPGDDEAAAIVLLDLMQRLDQLVMQVGQMIQPLHMLLYQIAPPLTSSDLNRESNFLTEM